MPQQGEGRMSSRLLTDEEIKVAKSKYFMGADAIATPSDRAVAKAQREITLKEVGELAIEVRGRDTGSLMDAVPLKKIEALKRGEPL